MLRHAKERDRLKAVNASEEAFIKTQLKVMDIAPPPPGMDRGVCDLEVKKLLEKKAIVEISYRESDGFVCALFVIPKKSGGFRPIVNLKPLNSFIRYEHFKMKILIPHAMF